MKVFLVYTAYRFGLFVVSYAVVVGIYLAVSGGGTIPLFWPFVVAILVSSIASVFVLRGPRDRFAASIERRASRMSKRVGRSREPEK